MPVQPARARRYAVCLGAAVVLASAACSGSPDGPEQTAQEFLRSLGARDTAAACSVVAYDGKPLAGDDIALCRTGFDTLVNDVFSDEELARMREATVTGVRVEGDAATVPEGQVSGELTAYLGEIALVRVDNRWYVNTQP
jgi:hypothetical protein